MNTPEKPNDPKKELVVTTRDQVEMDADEKMLQIDTVLNINELAENSVIVLKIGGDAGHKFRMHQAFVRFIQSKGDLFKQKHLTVLFLEPEDSLDVLTEQDMENAGWVKKEPSLIIKP